MLWLHIYLSMFGLAAVLFFSVTGLTLNHPDWFFAGAERSAQAEGRVDAKWLHLDATRPTTTPTRRDRSPSWRSSSTCGRPTPSAGRWPSSGSTTASAW